MWRRLCGSRPTVGSSSSSRRGPTDQADGDVEPTVHAPGERLCPSISDLDEVDACQRGCDLVAPLVAAQTAQPREVRQVLPHRELRVQGERLGHDTHQPLRANGIAFDGVAAHADATSIRAREASDHLQHRGLAGTVRPEQTVDLTGAYVERHVVDGGEVAEALHQAVHAQDGRLGRRVGCRLCGVVVSVGRRVWHIGHRITSCRRAYGWRHAGDQ
jgi:hypothetical protein